MLRIIDQISDYWLNFFVKVVLVACVAMSVKIAIQMKKEKVTLLNITLSFIIGIGFAMLSGSIILDTFSTNWATVVIAIVTLLGEKIGNWIIYKLNVDVLMQEFVDYLTRKSKEK